MPSSHSVFRRVPAALAALGVALAVLVVARTNTVDAPADAMTIGLDGVISPGNSPGTATTGSQTWRDGGSYLWEINDSDGSKGLTGGFLPMGVTMASERLYQGFISERPEATFFHGHSFTANPLGCAAALASLDHQAIDTAGHRLERGRQAGLLGLGPAVLALVRPEGVAVARRRRQASCGQARPGPGLHALQRLRQP